MKKTMYVSVVLAGLLGSLNAFAVDTTICSGTAGSGAVPASGTAGTHFMVSPITPKCSANVNLAGTDGTSGAWYAVGANSVKGKSTFGGHTNGGAVASNGTCAIAGGCTPAEAASARDTANAAAASS